MRSTIASVVWVLLLAGCGPGVTGSGSPPRSGWSAEDSVYADLLRGDAQQDSVLTLVVDTTMNAMGPMHDPTGLERVYHDFVVALPESLIQDFRGKLRTPDIPLNPDLLQSLAPQVRPARDLEAQLTFDEREGGTYRTSAGKPAIVLGYSRVGFDTEGRTALVHEYFSCGRLCGTLSLLLLRRDAAGPWEVAEVWTGGRM